MDDCASTSEVSSGPCLHPFSILIVDDEVGICDFLQRALSKHYSFVAVAHSSDEAAELYKRQHFDLLILDICMPGLSGIEWARDLQADGADVDVILMTGFADLESAVEAIRLGVSDFIMKPFRLEQMLAAVRGCCERQQLARENYALHRRLHQGEELAMVGDSPAMQQVKAMIERVAPVRSAVLIEGETGTGKELVAAALHERSGREGAFVPVNCGAIAPELIESELFGHVKGAFTGAGQAREGLFSYADGGTLFLDEMAEMPLLLQAKLLRVLEEGQIRPVGSEQLKAVDVRIIAASNRSLPEAVKSGEFRADLFYRLNVLPLTLPPLRARIEDIPALSRYLSLQLADELGLPPLPLSHQDIHSLQSYSWPGNVRELKNLLERAMLLGQLPHQLLTAADDNSSGGYPLSWSLADVELHHLKRVLSAQDGNKSRAADQLGITRKTLDRKLARDNGIGDG